MGCAGLLDLFNHYIDIVSEEFGHLNFRAALEKLKTLLSHFPGCIPLLLQQAQLHVRHTLLFGVSLS
jgi:hypothetical protein